MTFAWVAVGTIGAAVVGGVVSSSNASKAAKAQQNAANTAAKNNKDIAQQQIDLNEPFRQGGLAAQTALLNHLGVGGDPSVAGYGDLASANMPANWMDTSIDPGYNFRYQQGLKALNQRLNAGGGFISGSTAKGEINYGQDAASQEYQNAFNRYQTSRNNTLAPLLGQLGVGQTATSADTGALGQSGALNNENTIGAGNARASGYIGQSNAINGAISGITGALGSYATGNYMQNYMARSGY